MAVQRTFSIIKPDAVAKNVIGEILTRFEKAGLKVVASKMVHLSEQTAGGFYAEHKERPFFADLVKFMTSGPVPIATSTSASPASKGRSRRRALVSIRFISRISFTGPSRQPGAA